MDGRDFHPELSRLPSFTKKATSKVAFLIAAHAYGIYVRGQFGLKLNQPLARFSKISKAGSFLPSSTSKKAPPPVEM